MGYSLGMTKILAYTAGIIDGEGHIRPQSHRRSVVVGVSNTNKDLMNWLQTQYGGRVITIQPRGNRVVCYQWRLATEPGMDLLRRLLPYLIVKRGLAQEVLDSYKPRETHCRCGVTMDELNINCGRCRHRHRSRENRKSK